MISVGRLRAPYADDVAHYAKLLRRHVRLEQVELRDGAGIEARVAARLPTGTFVSLLDAGERGGGVLHCVPQGVQRRHRSREPKA